MIAPGMPGFPLIDLPKPALMVSAQVKAEVQGTGIGGMGLVEVMSGRADAPNRAIQLVIGHEMLGSIVDAALKFR